MISREFRAVLLLAILLPCGSLFSQIPADWPSNWDPYLQAEGSPIQDVTGDESPSHTDLASDGISSIYMTVVNTDVFFRMVLDGDPCNIFGGFKSATWIVQIAVQSGGVWTGVATAGIDGKPAMNDVVFVSNGDGSVTDTVYSIHRNGSSALRAVPINGTDQFYLDWQLPLSALTSVTSGLITASTPVRLFYGSSTSTSVINKDFMLGSSVDFTIVRTTQFLANPLPVQLSSFSASIEGNTAVLRWKTTMEINNYGFQVERSFDGSRWMTVGFVEGEGTTTTPRSYTHRDLLPAEAGLIPVLFYRLKQIDRDGTFEYSPVVQLHPSRPSAVTLDQNYPNPFNPETKIGFTLPSAMKVRLVVYDILGREVLILIPGETLPAGSHTILMDGTTLSSGAYFYTLVTPLGTTSRKMNLTK